MDLISPNFNSWNPGLSRLGLTGAILLAAECFLLDRSRQLPLGRAEREVSMDQMLTLPSRNFQGGKTGLTTLYLKYEMMTKVP